MRGYKVLPGSGLAAFRSRGDAVPAKDVPHRLFGNLMTYVGKGSRNAVVSPAGILSGHANDKLHNVLANWRAARVAAML